MSRNFFRFLLGLVYLTGSQAVWADSRNLAVEVEETLHYVGGPEFTNSACVPYLKDVYEKILSAQVTDYELEELRADYPRIVAGLWEIRRTLHGKLPEVSKECALAMRDVFRAVRAIEDYLGEWYYADAQLDPANLKFAQQPIPIMDKSEASPYHGYFVAPGMEEPGSDGKPAFKFRSGDIMITRGVSFLSATIARVGDIRSQFSHVVLVHVDEATGEASTIESYVGLGVGIYTMPDALRNENARILVLRPKDQVVAKAAAEFLFSLAQNRIARKKPIPYDYNLDFKDHRALSCAEVAEFAYEVASSGSMMLPAYPTEVSLHNDAFLEGINLRRGEFFTPGDMEIDPRFDLVLDWRDYRIIRDSRYKDAVFSSIMEWMDTRGYSLQQTTTSWAAGWIIWPGRRTLLWPLIQKTFDVPDFSKEIPRSTFVTMAQLKDLGAVLLTELRKVDAQRISATGFSMTNSELEAALENFRREDEARLRAGKDTSFHSLFRP